MNEDILNSPTFRLFALPSMLQGFGSVIDISGDVHCYNTNKSPTEADMESLRADWEAVGKDLQVALDEVTKEIDS
jgi:hypothetical protein